MAQLQSAHGKLCTHEMEVEPTTTRLLWMFEYTLGIGNVAFNIIVVKRFQNSCVTDLFYSISCEHEILAIPKDIANAKDVWRREMLAIDTAIKIESDSNPRLMYLLWAHPQTLELSRHYMGVVVLDCTYKTNKHNWPLLNMVILTGLNKVLPLAQCWLPGEAEPNYTWAFESLKTLLKEIGIPEPRLFATGRDLACTNASDMVFPDVPKILCRWHINRNVSARVQGDLGTVRLDQPGPNGETKKNTVQTNVFMAEYYETLESKTEADFDAHCVALYKSKIVKCWTDKYAHFGCHDTSTVEGTHAKIKRWLESSKGELLTVFLKLLPWWISFANAISYQSAKDATIIPHRLRYDQHSAVVRVISTYALIETNKLWKMAHNLINSGADKPLCAGGFRHMYGRPCIHELVDMYESNGDLKILPEHFDEHWWILSTMSVQSVVFWSLQTGATIEAGAVRIVNTRLGTAPIPHVANCRGSRETTDPIPTLYRFYHSKRFWKKVHMKASTVRTVHGAIPD
ncbi:PKS-NRPS hybrid synthetase [Phytophthora citrophthora]|uniref:PKS-NRPS hybrid synthetase n=1 Tax=Phytophthora citrophthora TaxID=4793 RepID=A0AAD9GZV9_9STRA|nr:PKS-NRPS hybrid synthetase [Phytophthora citrophthora]